MPNGRQFKGHQTRKPYQFHPCYIPTSYPTLKLIHLAKHQPTPSEKLTIFLLLLFSSFFSISIPSSSSLCSTTTFYLSLSNCENLYASSLLTPPFILLKTKTLVDLPIFCTLGFIRME
jgi:hypothetical protein